MNDVAIVLYSMQQHRIYYTSHVWAFKFSFQGIRKGHQYCKYMRRKESKYAQPSSNHLMCLQ
eukprot:4419614-Ditylum_brightwellii.AAC.1